MTASALEQNPVSFALAAGIALAVLIALALYAKRREIAAAVDPTSPDNLAYQGANAVGAALTGTPPGEFTLGGWIYDVTHPNAPRADAPAVPAAPAVEVDDFDASLSPDGWVPYILDVPGGRGASGSW